MATFIADPASIAAAYKFQTLITAKAEDLQSKQDFTTKENKLVEGKVQWKSNLSAVTRDEFGNDKRIDSNVGVAILTKSDIVSGVEYRLDGKIRVTPWIKEGAPGQRAQQGLSIVADRVVPVQQGENK